LRSDRSRTVSPPAILPISTVPATEVSSNDRIEIDRVHDDRVRLQLDHVLELVELAVRLVLGIERRHLVAHLREHGLERLLGLGLKLVQERRDHVVDRALLLSQSRPPGRQPDHRRARQQRAPPRHLNHLPCLPAWLGC
jgi:hypothetical protein